MAAPIYALRAKRGQHLPTVLSKSEVNRVLDGMQGLHQLMARLLYGCGLRLMECLCLRVKDIDFEQSQILVREGKGEKDRFYSWIDFVKLRRIWLKACCLTKLI